MVKASGEGMDCRRIAVGVSLKANRWLFHHLARIGLAPVGGARAICFLPAEHCCERASCSAFGPSRDRRCKIEKVQDYLWEDARDMKPWRRKLRRFLSASPSTK